MLPRCPPVMRAVVVLTPAVLVMVVVMMAMVVMAVVAGVPAAP